MFAWYFNLENGNIQIYQLLAYDKKKICSALNVSRPKQKVLKLNKCNKVIVKN
jgi:hypothetical protein